MLRARRSINGMLVRISNRNAKCAETTNTIDYLIKGDQPVFQTCEREKGKVVFQLGTNDPERALTVAKLM